MDARKYLAVAAVAAGLAAPAAAYMAGAGASDVPPPGNIGIVGDPAQRTRDAVAAWPQRARLLTAAIVREYGAPDEILPAQLIWRRRHPWTMIAVFRDAQSPERPNNLLQTLAYEVPLQRWRALSAFERGAAYDPVRRELAARTDSEETNLLALNLADEVIQGRRTAAEANDFYDRTLKLSYAGKSSSYMVRLMFSPALRQFTRRQPGLNDDLEREIQRFNDGK